MKKVLLSGLLAAAILLALASCAPQKTAPAPSSAPVETPLPTAENTSVPEEATPAEDDETCQAGQVLVAYFSATGNTRPLAEYAADILDADLYEIIPAQPYTDDDLNYNTDCRANDEQNDDSVRPAIEGAVEHMEQYNVILLGYPIWWGKAPKIIHTFLESYDFTGKTIVPFCTSASSGYNDSTITSLAEGAQWITGSRFSAGTSRDAMVEWINSLGLDLTVE